MVIVDNNIGRSLTTLYNVNGYIGICVDELGSLYSTSFDSYSTYITTSQPVEQVNEEIVPEIDPYAETLNNNYNL